MKQKLHHALNKQPNKLRVMKGKLKVKKKDKNHYFYILYLHVIISKWREYDIIINAKEKISILNVVLFKN